MNEYLICDDYGNPVESFDNIEEAQDALAPGQSIYTCKYTFVEKYDPINYGGNT